MQMARHTYPSPAQEGSGTVLFQQQLWQIVPNPRRKQSGRLHSYTATCRLENVRNFFEQMHGTQMPRPIHSL